MIKYNKIDEFHCNRLSAQNIHVNILHNPSTKLALCTVKNVDLKLCLHVHCVM